MVSTIRINRQNHIVSNKRKRMKLSIGTFLVLCGTLGASATARKWADIKTYHTWNVYDGRFGSEVDEGDPLLFTPHPSSPPSRSISPSMEPTVIPSNDPTRNPTRTKLPSRSPSSYPTKRSNRPSTMPSSNPSSEPTELSFPENDAPLNPNSSYFDYNVGPGADYGPGYPELVPHNETYIKIEYFNNGWTTRTPPKEWYWSEFDVNGTGPWKGILGNRNPTKNQCDGSPDQSPIDIRDNGAECLEHHQIRKLKGDYTLNSGQIQPQILSNKLRLLFARRPCAAVDQLNCSEPDPPQADFPNNWGGYTDLLHVDFKIPSEHLIYGERFDAEMQIVHLHPTRRRTPTVVSLMRASYTGYNLVLQQVLDRFQYLFETHASQCAARKRRDRKLITKLHRILGRNVTSSVDYNSWGDFSTALDAPDDSNETERRLLDQFFTPHDEMLVPSLYFFGYEGSLTEPPCSEFVTWFVCDVPMQMNFRQLDQLKKLQFEYVDPTCKRTSVHYRQSNARPIQDTFGRPVWRCTPRDFVADPPGYVNPSS